ncbi:hypothetical protein Trydic_g6435 [Trypoxylus dichotomus]
MKVLAILLLSTTLTYAGRHNIPNAPKGAQKDVKTPRSPKQRYEYPDLWWNRIRSALRPFVTPETIAPLDVNIPDGFIIYPFQYPHYLRPQIKHRITEEQPFFPPYYDGDVSRSNFRSRRIKYPLSPLTFQRYASPFSKSHPPLESIKTYPISDLSLVTQKPSTIVLLNQNKLEQLGNLGSLPYVSSKPLPVPPQEQGNYESPAQNGSGQKFLRLKQVALDRVNESLLKNAEANGQQLGEFGINGGSYVPASDPNDIQENFQYSVIEMYD